MAKFKRINHAVQMFEKESLPADLPSIFSFDQASISLKNNFSKISSYLASGKFGIYNLIPFSIPRGTSLRRELSIVNPIPQFALCLQVATKWSDIVKHIQQSRFTALTLNKPDKKLKSYQFFNIDFPQRQARVAKILATSSYFITCDVSKFFHSIYTHSIPWAIIGKDKGKELWAGRKINNHWSSFIDKCIRNMQSAQTIGIPVGPNMSRLIADIILVHLECRPGIQQLVKDCEGVRMVDDLIIGFADEGSAKLFLSVYAKELFSFGLHLNDNKTHVKNSIDFPINRNFDEMRRFKIDMSGWTKQSNSFHDFFNLAYLCAQESHDQAPVVWACKKLLNTNNTQKHFSTLLTFFLRAAKDFPICLPYLHDFLGAHPSGANAENAYNLLKRWLRGATERAVKSEHHFEIIWILLIHYSINFPVNSDIILNSSVERHSLIRLILKILHEKGCIQEKIPLKRWNSEASKAGLNSDQWIFAYESVRRKWTKNSNLISSVKNHSIFSVFLSDNVSFIDDGKLLALSTSTAPELGTAFPY